MSNASMALQMVKLLEENKQLRNQLENLRLPEVGDCFKFPGNPYTYKLCRLDVEGCKFFVLFNIILNNFYSEPKEGIKAAFGYNTHNYEHRIRVDDYRSK